MSSIQPGNGYTFSASSSGFNINIEKPWTPPIGDGLYVGFEFPDTRIPEQLVNAPMAVIRPAPFECRVVSVNGERFLQIAKGSIDYSYSNMPYIYKGAFTHISQAAAEKVQICPDTMREIGNIYPGGNPGIDPSYSLDWWMEDGGGYKLPDSSESYSIYAFKWDVERNATPFSDSAVVNTGLPTIAIIPSSNATDKAKIEKGTGPSIYENTMNVQKMNGYTDVSEMSGDWGHCHTTWYNPRKFGYNYKLIATISASSNSFTAASSIVSPAVVGFSNMIQKVVFEGNPSGGAVTITCGGFTSTVPFPVTNFYSAIVPVYSNELTLKACLESITAVVLPGVELPVTLAGNVEVSKYSDSVYYVTFVNQLQGVAVPPLSINTEAVTAYEWNFNITQHITGAIDLTTPMQFGMTQLMNKEDVSEPEDPYYLNRDNSTPWVNIVNRLDVLGCTGFSGDVVQDGMFPVVDGTVSNTDPDYSIVSGCTDEPTTDHPFKVIHVSTAGGLSTYRIVSGTVNNVTPGNIASNITVSTSTYEVWVKVPFAAGLLPNPTGFEWNIGTPLPADTDTEGYIRIATVNGSSVTQYVTGSLWADRIKMGSLTATYYYARV